MEWCINNQCDSQIYAERVDEGVDEEKLDLVQLAIDRVRELVPCRLWDRRITEQRVYFSRHMVPTETRAFGTADIFFPDFENRMLYELDAKFGHRYVPADSTQLIALAHGAQNYFYDLDNDCYSFDNFSLTILQPTLDSFPTVVMTWTELERWAEEVCRPKVIESLTPSLAKYDPDAGVCTYCNAQARCPARAEKLRALYGDFVFDYFLEKGEWPVMFEDRPLLNTDQLIALYPDVEVITSLMKDIQAHMTYEAQNGTVEVPGYTLGRRKTNRRLSPGVTAAQLQKDFGLLPSQVYTVPKLRTPKQIEDQLPSKKIDPKPREAFEKLVFKPPGDFILKKADDVPDHESLVAGFQTRERES